jgi:hypothetical protein
VIAKSVDDSTRTRVEISPLMSVWASPPGLLASTPPAREPDERAELLPRPSDPTKHWYHYGCLACEEIRVNKAVVSALCSPEELGQEPYKSSEFRIYDQ